MLTLKTFRLTSTTRLLRFAVLLSTLGSGLADAAELISTPAAPAPQSPNDASSYPASSDDGRWVAFTTAASNLVDGDSNGFTDVIRYDRQTGARVIASQAPGTPANGPASWGPIDISNDGRYVVFQSPASNLVAGDTNGRADLFRKDLQTGEILRLAWNPVQESSLSELNLSGDGRLLVFVDWGANWLGGPLNQLRVFQVDWSTLAVTPIAIQSANLGSGRVSLSSDGRCIAYSTQVGNFYRLRVRELAAGNEFWVDQTPSGGAPNGTILGFALDATCSAVGFTSAATDLLPSVTQPFHTYRRNLATQSLDWVSQRATPEPFNDSYRMSMSADARYFVYDRGLNDSNYFPLSQWFEYRDMQQPDAVHAGLQPGNDGVLVVLGGSVLALSYDAAPGDLNGVTDVHVAASAMAPMQQLVAPWSVLPTMASNGSSSIEGQVRRVEAGDGRWLAFESLATNLVAGVIETDALREVYLRDRLNGQTQRLLAAYAIAPNSDVRLLDISRDGRFVLLWSCASNLVANDNNGQCDIFIVDQILHLIELVNVSDDEVQATFEFPFSSDGQVTDNGRFVLFGSIAPNLVPSDDAYGQIYIRDRANGTTRLALAGNPAGLDGGTNLIHIATAGTYAVLWNTASNAQPDCYIVGVDLLTGERDCPTLDESGVLIYNAGIVNLSADGRFLLYSDPYDNTPNALLQDRRSGHVRVVNLAATDVTEFPMHFLSGNGRYVAAVSYSGLFERTGIYDLVLGQWVSLPAPHGGDGFLAINYSGTALDLSSSQALDPADQNGGISDIYRIEFRGDGVFGGGWQGGFE